jgi:hypothetical protein
MRLIPPLFVMVSFECFIQGILLIKVFQYILNCKANTLKCLLKKQQLTIWKFSPQILIEISMYR